MEEKKKHIVIVTDTWEPQVNGVVRTLSNIKAELEKSGNRVSVIWPDDKKYENFSLPFYPQIKLPVRTKKSDAYIPRLLKELHPDQIYIATEGPLGLAAANYCYYHKPPLNYTTGYHTKFDEYAGEFVKKTPLAPLAPAAKSVVASGLKWFHKTSAYVLAPSPSMRDELIAKGYDSKQVVAWTRGVDREIFRPLKPGEASVFEKYKAKGPVWLNVGRVSHEKGVEEFLKLPLAGTKVVVGDGPVLESLKEKYKTSQNIIFTGEKKGEELAKLYRGADVFVFPSKADTFGNVQLEALASGLPVAAYPVTGPKDVITRPDIGALDNNLEAACRKAYALVDSPSKKERCAKACVEHVAQNFTWKKAAWIFQKHLVDVREKLVRKTPPPEYDNPESGTPHGDKFIAKKLLERLRGADSRQEHIYNAVGEEIGRVWVYDVSFDLRNAKATSGKYDAESCIIPGLGITVRKFREWIMSAGLSNGGYSHEPASAGKAGTITFTINSEDLHRLAGETPRTYGIGRLGFSAN